MRTNVIMSVEVRGAVISLALPLRRADVAEEPAQFLDVEVLVLGRGPRIEPAMDGLSGVLEEKEAVERVRDGEV